MFALFLSSSFLPFSLSAFPAYLVSFTSAERFSHSPSLPHFLLFTFQKARYRLSFLFLLICFLFTFSVWSSSFDYLSFRARHAEAMTSSLFSVIRSIFALTFFFLSFPLISSFSFTFRANRLDSRIAPCRSVQLDGEGLLDLSLLRLAVLISSSFSLTFPCLICFLSLFLSIFSSLAICLLHLEQIALILESRHADLDSLIVANSSDSGSSLRFSSSSSSSSVSAPGGGSLAPGTRQLYALFPAPEQDALYLMVMSGSHPIMRKKRRTRRRNRRRITSRWQ